MNVHSASKPLLARLMPYLCSLLAVVSFYGVSLVAFHQPFFAAGMAAVGAISAFMLCRVVQMRGKLSLAATALGLPLLIAVTCTVMLKLSPFVDRQQSIIAMKNAGVGFRSVAPDQAGEWLRDRSGNMLPVWLAERIGNECLTEVRVIESEIGALQSIDFDRIDTARLFKVRLTRSENQVPLSEELVAWLNLCPELSDVSFEFDQLSDQEASRLAELRIGFGLAIRDLDKSAPLPALAYCEWLVVNSTELTSNHAVQFTELKRLQSLLIDSVSFADQSIESLSGLPPDCLVSFRGSPLDLQVLLRIAKLGRTQVQLENVRFGDVSQAGFRPLPVRTSNVRVFDSTLSLEQCRRIAELFRCGHLMLFNLADPIARDEPIQRGEELPVFELTKTNVQTLWSLPDLEYVSYFDQGWVEFQRPSEPE